MGEKFFPIKTSTACQLKWTWSTITLYTGETNSCHRVGSSILSLENFNDFHNTPKKINDRQLMLDGQWPQGGCEYCQNIESSGGQSDRMFHLQIPDLSPPELDRNPSAVVTTPRIVEVYLDNVCNMSCIYCWDGFSSKIQRENEVFGTFDQDGVYIGNRAIRHPDHGQITEKFWNWMHLNYQTLRRFHVLGGEPFFQSSFETCMDFLENHSNPELEFNIVSNLKVSPSKLEKFVERIKKLIVDRRIKRFDVTCSIDCWGDAQEYIRHGIDLDQWQKNFDYLSRQKWMTININQTITGLGIHTMPELIKFINHHRKNRPIGHYFMACVNRSHLYPGIFGNGFFTSQFNEIINAMPGGKWDHDNAKQMMLGLQKEFDSHDTNYQEIKKLGIFLDEIDRRRNLDWTKVFPWLVPVIEESHHVV